MKMGGFDMMALMNSASQGAAKPKYEAKTLPIDAIIPNPANHYSMAGIDELADSILMAGRVLQNIVVKAADADGRYMIISGHRRHLACQKLVAEGHTEFREIAALVENEADENMRELMLIYTNSTARELTDAEKMRQAQRATDILKQIKAEGKLQAPLRETVARMLGTASGQIARYAAIANNLTNKDLQEAFEEERIGVSTAYESSRLSDEGQAEIADKLHAAGTVTLRDVEEVKRREQEHTPAAEAPPPATPPCAETQTANPCTPPQEPENPADFPYATDSPKAYAIMAVYGELKALMESYRGAAQRAIAIAEDGKGAANLSAAAEYVQTLMEIVEQEMADIEAGEG